jgi:hypothetical protein
MRLVAGHVELADAEGKERLIPVPERAGEGEKTRQRTDDRDDPECQALPLGQ